MALGLMAGALPDDHELAMQILAELRGPRVAAAFACGGLLALAGALMQTLFRNPLAEPYLLGVSGGAGLLALLGMAAGLAWPWVSALAFAGSLLALALAAALGGRLLARDHTPLLLAGVMLAAGFGALIALVLSVTPAERLPGMLFFLMGDLAWTGQPALLWAALLLAVAAALGLAGRLDVLQLSPLESRLARRGRRAHALDAVRPGGRLYRAGGGAGRQHRLRRPDGAARAAQNGHSPATASCCPLPRWPAAACWCWPTRWHAP